MTCERPKNSFDPICERKDDQFSPAIHAFFDRFENELPRYVSIIPSRRAGLKVTLCLFLFFAFLLSIDAFYYRKSQNPYVKYRWIVGLTVTLYVSIKIGLEVQQYLFRIHNLTMNKQHFANIDWLKMYANALRPALF